MAQLRIDTGELRSLAATYESQAYDIETSISRLPPPEAIWEGSMPSAFYAAHDDVQRSRHELVERLREMSSLIRRAADAYESASADLGSALGIDQRFEE